MKIPDWFRKWAAAILVLAMASALALEARVFVFPFEVREPERTDHQWLGRAISFHLTKGLELNSIKTFSDMNVQSILGTYNINFPYTISKASGIKLSLIFRADFMVGGEVIPSQAPESADAQVRAFIIDLKNFSQKYLPLIKFHIRDLSLAQKELLNLAGKYFGKTGMVIPESNMDNHGYETFIKGLLLTDPQKKITLLEGIFPLNPNSEWIAFELAQACLAANDPKRAEHYLNALSAAERLKPDKQFLIALHCYHQGNRGEAQKIFSDMVIREEFIAETLNNLGAILCQNNRYAEAEKYYIRSLQEIRDPQVFGNYVNLLVKSGQNEKARAILNSALLYFPDDENLLGFFSFFISRDPNRDRLITLFQKYVPEISPDSRFPSVSYRLKNPFELQTYENRYSLPDWENPGKSAHQEKSPEAMRNFEKLLEVNPFIPGLHRLLEEIYRSQNDPVRAELHQLGFQFLKNQNPI